MRVLLALILRSKFLGINFGELFSDYFGRVELPSNPPYRSEKTLKLYAVKPYPNPRNVCILALKPLVFHSAHFLENFNSCDLTTRSLS